MRRTAPYRPADNPFASHRVEALRYRRGVRSFSEIETRLEELGGRAALVGPKGSGKTTLLEELGERLPGPTLTIRIPGGDPHPYRRAIGQLPQRGTQSLTILVDSAEQLGALAWRAFLGRTVRARRLVATLHRPGRLPTLWECTTSPQLLHGLVAELAPEYAAALRPNLDPLFRRHDGNIRSCLRELYDVYAGRR